MKLRELLKLPVFNGASIMAGHQGLDREVHTVNMMDAPDIANYLKKHELLVTTAFHVRDNLSSLLTLIESMHEQQCAGIGIKTKRFLQSIPQEAIDLANKRNIPIIDLPADTSLGDIVTHSLTYILNIRTNELHQAMQTHQHFTQLVTNGQGLPKIMESLSSLINAPVTLLNQQMRPQHGAGVKTSPERFRQCLSSSVALLPSSYPIALSLIDSSQETITLFPVHTHKKQYSYLAVHRFIAPVDQADILIVEQAVNVIAFELMKENALKQKTQRLQTEFFNNFLNDHFSSQEEVLSRAKEFGLSGQRRYLCAAGKIDDLEKNLFALDYQSEKELIYDAMEAELKASPETIHLFTTEQTYIFLMEVAQNWKESETAFCFFLTQIQAAVHALFQDTISFGISHYAEQLMHVPVAYKEAADALYYGTMLGRKQFIELYQPKEVPEILRMIPYEQLQKFFNNTFQPFFDEAKKDCDVLLHTLSVYLETHCQLSETAKRLFIHRNTVIYRLEKCEEILGRSLKDPDETMHLRLAFRIKALLQNS